MAGARGVGPLLRVLETLVIPFHYAPISGTQVYFITNPATGAGVSTGDSIRFWSRFVCQNDPSTLWWATQGYAKERKNGSLPSREWQTLPSPARSHYSLFGLFVLGGFFAKTTEFLPFQSVRSILGVFAGWIRRPFALGTHQLDDGTLNLFLNFTFLSHNI